MTNYNTMRLPGNCCGGPCSDGPCIIVWVFRMSSCGWLTVVNMGDITTCCCGDCCCWLLIMIGITSWRPLPFSSNICVFLSDDDDDVVSSSSDTIN